MVPVIVVHVAEPVMVQSGHLRYTPFFLKVLRGWPERLFAPSDPGGRSNT